MREGVNEGGPFTFALEVYTHADVSQGIFQWSTRKFSSPFLKMK